MAIRCGSQQLGVMEPVSQITRIAKAAMITALRDHPEFSELFMADFFIEPEQGRIEEDLIDPVGSRFERETVGAGASASGEFRQRSHRRADHWEDQSGNSRRDDRHDPIARSQFHE